MAQVTKYDFLLNHVSPEVGHHLLEVKESHPAGEGLDEMINDETAIPLLTLRTAFTWGETSQGHDYWEGVASTLPRTIKQELTPGMEKAMQEDQGKSVQETLAEAQARVDQARKFEGLSKSEQDIRLKAEQKHRAELAKLRNEKPETESSFGDVKAEEGDSNTTEP